MTNEDCNILNRKVDAKLCDGTTKEGVIKGIRTDCEGIHVSVEYEMPTTSEFKPEDVTLK